MQKEINKRQGLDYQLIVQRIVVIQGPQEKANLITGKEGGLIKAPTPERSLAPISETEQQLQKQNLEEAEQQEKLHNRNHQTINQTQENNPPLSISN